MSRPSSTKTTSGKTTSGKTRVALFNPIFAHYREALLRAMRGSSRCEYSFFADPIDDLDRIPALDLTEDSRYFPTRRKRLLRFTWQSGALQALRHDFDVYILIGNAEWLSSWVIALLARLRGKRVLFWTHGWTRHDGIGKRCIRHTMYRLAHGLLLYSERARTMGLSYGFRRESLYVVYNSLDFERQRLLAGAISRHDAATMRKFYFGDANCPVVVTAARLTRVKRFDLVIDALALLADRGRRIHLLVVGDGPERGALETLAGERGIAAAFAGACYDEAQLAKLFACANVTASPGNIGLTCMHSLGYGVPVVTHNDPDSQGPEWEAIAPDSTGSFFNRDSVEGLARAIDRWTQDAWIAAATQERCIDSIRSRYHPINQHRLIESAVLGEEAIIDMGQVVNIG